MAEHSELAFRLVTVAQRCLALMIWMMWGHGSMGHGGHGEASGDGKRSAEAGRILAERFARGEITEEEFEQRKRVLEGTKS
jgi:uncharacterized membrane protein